MWEKMHQGFSSSTAEVHFIGISEKGHPDVELDGQRGSVISEEIQHLHTYKT